MKYATIRNDDHRKLNGENAEDECKHENAKSDPVRDFYPENRRRREKSRKRRGGGGPSSCCCASSPALPGPAQCLVDVSSLPPKHALWRRHSILQMRKLEAGEVGFLAQGLAAGARRSGATAVAHVVGHQAWLPVGDGLREAGLCGLSVLILCLLMSFPKFLQ